MERMLYTIAEAAEMLGLSKGMVVKLAGNGELRTIKLGRSRRVTAGDLKAYVQKAVEAAASR